MKFDLSNIGEFYKKVVDFFSKDDKEESKSVATNRLKLVLMQDRTNLNPRLLERLRGEIHQRVLTGKQ